MQTTRVTDLIRLDHVWFRSQFAALASARDDQGTLASLWAVLPRVSRCMRQRRKPSSTRGC